uniref:Aminotransferase-like plant mobile domain-containing protein n=1 Tax=Fagus sylvatica TaxID=28930 RepID=A0A2N9FZF8_FAGSY
MASSSTAPVGPPPQPGSGEELEVPPSAPAASTEAMVDAPSRLLHPFQANLCRYATLLSFPARPRIYRKGLLFPLIDPWYTSSPSLSSSVRGLRFSPRGGLGLDGGDLQATPINFDFLCAASKDWSHWVDREILDPDFWDRLVDAGVHWSILISRSCNMFRDTESPSRRRLQQLLRKRASTRLKWLACAFFINYDEGCQSAVLPSSVLYWLCHMGMIHPGFTCASIFRKFYGPSPLIRDLKVDDFRSLSYLSTVSPGFLPVLSATGVYFIPYCPQRVQRQFGLDQGIPIGPQETGLASTLPSMGAYWQRFTQSMVDFVITGRSDKTPMSVHRKASVSNPYLTPPSQSAISYANNQKLGFAEWDASRGGWIAYTIHLPEGWRNSVNVVEDRLIMLSKRVPSAAKESTTALVQGSAKSATASLLRRKDKGRERRVNPLPSVPSAVEESTATPLEEPAESTESPPKKAKAWEEEQVHCLQLLLPPKKKKFTAPLFPLGASWVVQGARVVPKSVAGGTWVPVGSGGVMWTSDVADGWTYCCKSREERCFHRLLPWTRMKIWGKARQAALKLTRVVSAGSTADDDNMSEADDSSMEAAGFRMEEELAIVPHGGHDDDSFDVSMAHVMEGVSLFGVTPSLRAVPAGGFVIPASRLSSEDSPVVGGAVMPKETHAQDLVESGSVVDLGVDAAGHDAPIEDAGISVVDTLAGSDHLENIGLGYRLMKCLLPWTWVSSHEMFDSIDLGVDDAMHVSEEIDEVGITVAAFFREFDTRAPNPHPEQFFWSFNGPLVPFGDFWVPNDCSPYLSRLSAGHSDFTKGFKLSIGLGGPMMSLLGSVLAAMDESSP